MSKLLLVEIFWDGDGFYFANPGDSERLGGPHNKLHDAWKEADGMGLEVVRVDRTRGHRTYRKTPPEKPLNANSEAGLQTLRKA